MASSIPTLTLNDGHEVPAIGFGTAQIKGQGAPDVFLTALAAGYRLIDTAAKYENEAEVGAALASATVPREEIAVTSKVWPDRLGRDETLKSFDESLARLGIDSIDIFLIHWPGEDAGKRLESWKALIELREAGRARSIGVSNFSEDQLEALIGETGVTPVLNQVQLHPLMQQRALRAVHTRLGIVTESWSPLGRRKLWDDPVISAVAEKHGRSNAQTILRWHLQLGLLPIPKSADPGRIAENLAVFDFELDQQDLDRIASLDSEAMPD